MNRSKKYKKIRILGEGQDGVTWLVTDKSGKEWAMKTFKPDKCSKLIAKEAILQFLSFEKGAAPSIIEVDTNEKFIVMEKMDLHLFDLILSQKGDLTVPQQEEILEMYKRLDEAKVFQSDSNIMNYMYRTKKNKDKKENKKELIMIDYGISRDINPELKKSLNSENPNYDIMNVGLILKLKEMNCIPSSYAHLSSKLKPCFRSVAGV